MKHSAVFQDLFLSLVLNLFDRSLPFRTFFQKMTFLLLVVQRSSAIKMISTWMKAVSTPIKI